MMNFIGAKEFVLNKLKKELKPNLFYHCFDHTIDVYESAINLAKFENITGNDLVYLETAALFHDTGFLFAYNDHEEGSIEFAKTHLPCFGYTKEEIDIITKMIRTTKLPQSPTTLTEKILCDADLDYMGRDDFFMIANRLLCEWNLNGFSVTLKKMVSHTS